MWMQYFLKAFIVLNLPTYNTLQDNLSSNLQCLSCVQATNNFLRQSGTKTAPYKSIFFLEKLGNFWLDHLRELPKPSKFHIYNILFWAGGAHQYMILHHGTSLYISWQFGTHPPLVPENPWYYPVYAFKTHQDPPLKSKEDYYVI